jgi:hypothetical protein
MKHLDKIEHFSRETQGFKFRKVIEANQAFFSLTKGSRGNGLFNDEWALHCLKNLSSNTIHSAEHCNQFTDKIWESFYNQKTSELENNPISLNTFEKYGSGCRMNAVWITEKNNHIFADCLSIGKNTILKYNKSNDELVIGYQSQSPFDFLNDTSELNWNNPSIEEDSIRFLKNIEIDSATSVIIGNAFLAEHLILTYLLIKSHDDKYWDKLVALIQDNEKLTDLFLQLRGVYQYQKFEDYLIYFEYCLKNETTNTILNDQISFSNISDYSIIYQRLFYKKDHNLASCDTIYPESESIGTVPIREVKPIPSHRILIENKNGERKKDSQKIVDYCLDNRIFKLYHFTDRKNIPFIKMQGGLYSWDYLHRNGLSIPMQGGDSLSRLLDCKYGLQNYVRTSFCKNHPMGFIAKKEVRIIDLVILEIDPEIMTWKPTLFSNMNATKNNHSKGLSFSDLEEIRIDIIQSRIPYFNLNAGEKSFYQAEVMALEHVPSKYILNLDSFR